MHDYKSISVVAVTICGTDIETDTDRQLVILLAQPTKTIKK